MPDGKDTSWLCPVSGGRVAEMPGGEALGKCRVMCGLEVGLPFVVRLWVSTGNASEKSHPGSMDCGRLTFCLENKHFNTLDFFYYIMGVVPTVLPSILGISLR